MCNKLDFKNTNIKILSDVSDDDDLNAYKLRGCSQVDPTESNILTTIKTMVKDIPEYSFVFFHYSGHGVSIKDNSGDELDGKDEALYTSDGKVIVDDDL